MIPFAIKMTASVRRWWHCLWGSLGDHRMEDHYYKDVRVRIGCSCGRCFWRIDLS